MQAPQYGAEVAGEEQQRDGGERTEEGGDLMLALAVVGVPDLGTLRMVAGRIASDEVPHGGQHDEERSKQRHEPELTSCHRGPRLGRQARGSRRSSGVREGAEGAAPAPI